MRLDTRVFLPTDCSDQVTLVGCQMSLRLHRGEYHQRGRDDRGQGGGHCAAAWGAVHAEVAGLRGPLVVLPDAGALDVVGVALLGAEAADGKALSGLARGLADFLGADGLGLKFSLGVVSATGLFGCHNGGIHSQDEQGGKES